MATLRDAPKSGWVPEVPSYATESEQGRDLFRAELRIQALEAQVAGFNRAIIDATRGAHSCFGLVKEAFPGAREDTAAVASEVESLLGRALLLLTTEAQGAMDLERMSVAEQRKVLELEIPERGK